MHRVRFTELHRRPSTPILILLLVALLVAACAPVEPPDSGASATDDGGRPGPCLEDEPRLIHYARWLATDPDPRLDALRRRYQLEQVAASDVELVADPVLCARAGRIYRDALDLPDSPRAVAMFRIGDRYVVSRRIGEASGGSPAANFGPAVLVDESLQVLGVFGG